MFWLRNKKINCLHDVAWESVEALTDHFAYAFVRENIARIYDDVATL